MKESFVVSDNAPQIATEEKVQPGSNKAILTLADGSQVVLDAAASGAISNQGGVTVIKLNDGELSYQKGETEGQPAVYNTISTPRGGQYQLVLSDNTRVWLNAESSLRYPVAFDGALRKVTLTGEGYFEVAHDGLKPFHVQASGMDIEVLGTHFNVNAYADEGKVRTTLLEGAVPVNAAGKTEVLKPGQQATLQSENNALTISSEMDVDQVVAWKNGYFSFQDASLRDVMRQISRWYDVDVKYVWKEKDRKFRGGISRSSDLDDVLTILERSRVNFKVEGRTILVTQ